MTLYPIHVACGGPLLLREQAGQPHARERLFCGKCHRPVATTEETLAQTRRAAEAEGIDLAALAAPPQPLQLGLSPAPTRRPVQLGLFGGGHR